MLALRLSVRKSEIKNNSDNVHWNVWTNIKNLYARKNVFKKRILNVRFWIIFILVRISFFWRLLWDVLASVFLKIFHPRPTMVADIFTQSTPHHKKASYGPVSAQKFYNFITLSVWIVYKHMCLKIQLCLKIWFSTSFDITRYAGAAISAKNLLFFSFYNFFVKFSE